MKKEFEIPELSIYELSVADIITTSNLEGKNEGLDDEGVLPD